ncbi:MAG: substrate-binding domain-containing protein [Spirochaetales bacterium]|nr:substrate-binding domain-containing protein [Spirochaetales bacterium]
MRKKPNHNSCPRFGVFSSWFYGDYLFEFVSGIEYEAKHKDVQVVYFTGRSLHSPYSYDDNHNIVYDIAHEASLDGLVIMSGVIDYSTNTQINDFVSRYSSLPLITIDFKTVYGNAILSNNAPGFRKLLQHLIENHGYRKFAFINGPETNFDAIERSDIYRSMLDSYSIPFDPAFIINGHFTYHSGKNAIVTFLDHRNLQPGKDIEVIVCANDVMARGVLDELKTRGIRVPSDIALTGFDGIRYAFFPKPLMTTVRQYVFEIGKTAISNLLDYDPNRADVVFDTELIIHSSCGCSPGDNRKNQSIDPYTQKSGSVSSEKTIPENIGLSEHREDIEFFFLDILASIDNLKFLKNMSEFDEWFARHLPGLGIESADLFIYTDSPAASPTVKRIAEYKRKPQKQSKRKKNIPLNSIFDEILSGSSEKSYCILPLLHENEQYGLLAMEVNLNSAGTYDILYTQLANCIKSINLTKEVERINQKLHHSNKQKTRFFINVAHEMKTPLTLIQNYLEQYMKRTASDPDLEIIKQNIDILLENMLNFLDAERLEKGTMIYSHDSVIDLSEAVQKKCTLFQPVAFKKAITLRLQVEYNVTIKIDPWALDRILNNLLDNAIKYTQKGGKVWVEVKKIKGKAQFCVKDNGPGLSNNTFLHLFEPYYQLSQKRSSSQGIGVGLSIVKKIIDDLGASITVKKNRGTGTCFTCVFTASNEPADAQDTDNTPLIKPLVRTIFKEDITEEDITGDKTSILIVDDNVQMLHFLKVSLKKTYNIFLATDVQTALEKLKTIDRPELIISDIMMDGIDGHTFLATLTKTEDYCDIPFIFLSAASGKDEEIRGLAGGAIDYIKKPFSITELEKKIHSIITLRTKMKKREIIKIRKRLDNFFSKIEEGDHLISERNFESLCSKYDISSREEEIIKLLLEGHINKEISDMIHISKRAVEYHITKIFKKIGASNRFDLITIFRI